ncbi:MAG: alpha/beta hydrolase [Acidobacteriota bacterium]|nr:alpha/beta hydrolase [Acidobacteriota bacterium]
MSRWLLLGAAVSVLAGAAASVAAAAGGGSRGGGKPRVKTDPDAAPELVRTAKGTVEVGTLGGVPYRIDVPAEWNHSLVVFFHGYSETPTVFRTTGGINEVTGPVLERGFAIVQSAYSLPGWALAEGVPESEALRQYFVKRYGKVTDTIAAGVSMGGAMVMVTIEQNPKPYAGALDLCGAVGPTYEAFQRRFAWRAAFDYYFPGIMPPLVPAPAEYRESAALRDRILAALKANPSAATEMRNLTGLHTDADLMRDVSYFTYVITDMQHRSGGNPFDNRNTVYVGTTPGVSSTDEALNDGVRRYPADEAARRYLVSHYTPSGRVTRPMLAVHTTYDPLIPGWTLARYADQIAEAGYGENFVQQYVHREGHCAISPRQVGASLDELLEWIHSGRRPAPGLLR